MLRTILLTGAAIAAFSSASAQVGGFYSTPGFYTLDITQTGDYNFYVFGADGGNFAANHGGTGGYLHESDILTAGSTVGITVGAYLGVDNQGGSSFIGSSLFGVAAIAHGGYAATGAGQGAGGQVTILGSDVVRSVPGVAGGGMGDPGVVEVIGPAVPEPSTWSLMLGGFGLLGYVLRRRILRAA